MLTALLLQASMVSPTLRIIAPPLAAASALFCPQQMMCSPSHLVFSLIAHLSFLKHHVASGPLPTLGSLPEISPYTQFSQSASSYSSDLSSIPAGPGKLGQFPPLQTLYFSLAHNGGKYRTLWDDSVGYCLSPNLQSQGGKSHICCVPWCPRIQL